MARVMVTPGETTQGRSSPVKEVQIQHPDRGENLGREGFSESLKSCLTCVYFCFLLKCCPFISPYRLKARAYVQGVCPHDRVSTCSGDNIVIGTGRKRLVSQLVLFFSSLMCLAHDESFLPLWANKLFYIQYT